MVTAYLEVLYEVLKENGRKDILNNLSDIGLKIEMGVSNKTLLALTSLGISRSSAVLIFEFMLSGDLWIEEVVSWLREQDYDMFELPRAVKDEIKLVLDTYKGI